MKTIEHGKKYDPTKILCECECVFKYEKYDIKKEYDDDNGRSHNCQIDTKLFINCPECNKKIYLDMMIR